MEQCMRSSGWAVVVSDKAGDRLGSCFPFLRMESTSHTEEIPSQIRTEGHYLCAVSGLALGLLLHRERGCQPVALDSSTGQGRITAKSHFGE